MPFDHPLPDYPFGICYRRMGAALIIFLFEMAIATCRAKVIFCALQGFAEVRKLNRSEQKLDAFAVLSEKSVRQMLRHCFFHSGQ